jgi:hypothetical protein
VALEGKTYTVAGVIAGEITDMQVVAASGEELRTRHLLAKARGNAQALEYLGNAPRRLVVAKIQYLDQRRPMGSRTLGRRRASGSPHTAASWLDPGQKAIDAVT